MLATPDPIGRARPTSDPSTLDLGRPVAATDAAPPRPVRDDARRLLAELRDRQAVDARGDRPARTDGRPVVAVIDAARADSVDLLAGRHLVAAGDHGRGLLWVALDPTPPATPTPGPLWTGCGYADGAGPDPRRPIARRRDRNAGRGCL